MASFCLCWKFFYRWKFYVDGVNVYNYAWSTPATTATTNWIGRRAYVGSENYFLGNIDDVIYFNRVLSVEEIKILYQVGR
jgi:hypothetical protein